MFVLRLSCGFIVHAVFRCPFYHFGIVVFPLQDVDWRPLVCAALESKLRAVLVESAAPLPKPALAEAYVALCVLGGFAERLRAGGAVKVSRDLDGSPYGFGYIMSYAPHLSSVEVVLDESSAKKQAAAAPEPDEDEAAVPSLGGHKLFSGTKFPGGKAPRAVPEPRSAWRESSGGSSSSGECVVSVSTDRLHPMSPMPLSAANVSTSLWLTVAEVVMKLGLTPDMKLPDMSYKAAGAFSVRAAFSSEHSSPSIQITDNEQVAASQSEGGRAVVDCCMNEGRWSWEMQLTKDNNDDECSAFGVGVRPFGDSYNSRNMFTLRSYNGELYSNGTTLPARKSKIHPNDVVRCEYDAVMGTVEIWINDQSQGVCFNDIRGEVYPVVAFYSSAREARLLSIDRLDRPVATDAATSDKEAKEAAQVEQKEPEDLVGTMLRTGIAVASLKSLMQGFTVPAVVAAFLSDEEGVGGLLGRQAFAAFGLQATLTCGLRDLDTVEENYALHLERVVGLTRQRQLAKLRAAAAPPEKPAATESKTDDKKAPDAESKDGAESKSDVGAVPAVPAVAESAASVIAAPLQPVVDAPVLIEPPVVPAELEAAILARAMQSDAAVPQIFQESPMFVRQQAEVLSAPGQLIRMDDSPVFRSTDALGAPALAFGRPASDWGMPATLPPAVVSESAVAELMALGDGAYPKAWCELALRKCSGDVAAALNWILDRSDALATAGDDLSSFDGPASFPSYADLSGSFGGAPFTAAPTGTVSTSLFTAAKPAALERKPSSSSAKGKAVVDFGGALTAAAPKPDGTSAPTSTDAPAAPAVIETCEESSDDDIPAPPRPVALGTAAAAAAGPAGEAEVEDNMEEEVGDSHYSSSNRFFRKDGSTSSADERALSGKDYVRAAAASRALAWAPGHSRSDAVKTLSAMDKDEALQKALVKSSGVLAALLSRVSLYTLLLQWHNSNKDKVFSASEFFGDVNILEEQDSRAASVTSEVAEAAAAAPSPDNESSWNGNQLLLKALQLGSCRSESARWWLKKLSFLNTSSSRGLRTKSQSFMRDVLTPLVHSAVVPDAATAQQDVDVDDGADADAFTAVLYKLVRQQLVAAAHRKFAEFLWAEKSYLGHTDVNVLKEPNLNFVQWITDQLLTAARAGDNWEAELVALQEMYGAWSVTLRSPSMSLKEHGFRRLCDILERVSAIDQQRQVAGDVYGVDWAPFYTLVPAERIEAVAMRRLDKEKEDAPRYSRYVQCLVEFAALLRYVREKIGSTPDTPALSSRPGAAVEPHFGLERSDSSVSTSSAPRLARQRSANSVAFAERPRYLLRFAGGAECYVTVSGEDLAPPWTAEFWVRRAGKPGKLRSVGRTYESVKAAAGTSNPGVKLEKDDKRKPSHKCLASSMNNALLLECGRCAKNHKWVGLYVNDGSTRSADPYLPANVLPFEYEAPVGEWTHLAFVATQSTVTLIANGKEIGSHNIRMHLPMSLIGAKTSGLKGDLQEVTRRHRLSCASCVDSVIVSLVVAAGSVLAQRPHARRAHAGHAEAAGLERAPLDDGGVLDVQRGQGSLRC